MAGNMTDSAGAGDEIDRSIHLAAGILSVPDLEYYDMSKAKKMIIFNHYEFDYYTEIRRRPKTRGGTDSDVAALKNTFSKLEFDIQIYKDKTRDQILGIVKDLCKQEYNTTSCVSVCVLTHGGQGGQLFAHDKTYYLSELLSLLQNHAPGLVGVPKLVIVQACRGGLADAGLVRVDGPGQAELLPSHIDTLVLTASVEDYKSFRNGHGSWLIQEFCRVVAARYSDLDVLHIATLVTSLVAQRKTNSRKKLTQNKKQSAETRSSLTKLLRFTPEHRHL